MKRLNNYLKLLGLSKKAGFFEIGEKALACARAKKARLIIIASDASDNSKRRAGHYAAVAGLPSAVLPATKAELGVALGIDTCAVAAITDTGMAAAFAAKLAEADTKYEKQSVILQNKLKCEKERKKETRARIKNKCGKKSG